MSKDSALAAWLDRAIDTPRVWGRHDCTLWPANWVVECGHGDPAAEWRGRYRTLLGAARLARPAGGMEALFARGAEASGLRRASRVIAGDVGLLAMPTAALGPTLGASVGAISIGGGEWAVVHDRGLWMGHAPVIAAWRVRWLTR